MQYCRGQNYQLRHGGFTWISGCGWLTLTNLGFLNPEWVYIQQSEVCIFVQIWVIFIILWRWEQTWSSKCFEKQTTNMLWMCKLREIMPNSEDKETRKKHKSWFHWDKCTLYVEPNTYTWLIQQSPASRWCSLFLWTHNALHPFLALPNVPFCGYCIPLISFIKIFLWKKHYLFPPSRNHLQYQ